MPPYGWQRLNIAIVKASQTSYAVMRSNMDQPSTVREYRPITTARYSQP